MTTRTRGLAANASLALAGDALAKAGMFAALLVLARTVTVIQYAQLGIAMAAMMIATSVLDGGVGIVAIREGAADPATRRPLLRAGATARLPLAAAVAAVLLGVGAATGNVTLALAVLATSLVNAGQFALFATFRSTQNLLYEALAKGFCGVAYPLVCLGAAAAGHHSASAAMLAFALPPLMTLPGLLAGARSRSGVRGGRMAPGPLLRRSFLFGLVAVATLLYYRAPMLLMGLLSPHSATASYSVAANLGFGVLMLPAAIATGLLPKLSAELDAAARDRLVRRTLVWTTWLVVVTNLAVGTVSFWLVPILYGPAYRSAVEPLLILLASGVVIAAAGIVGTALVAMGRRREIVRQVSVAVAVNVIAGLVLIPVLAAEGAALATFVTEVVSLAILGRAFVRCIDRPEVAPLRGGRPREVALP